MLRKPVLQTKNSVTFNNVLKKLEEKKKENETTKEPVLKTTSTVCPEVKCPGDIKTITVELCNEDYNFIACIASPATEYCTNINVPFEVSSQNDCTGQPISCVAQCCIPIKLILQ